MATPKKLIKRTIALNVEVLVDGVVKTELKTFDYNPAGQRGSGRLLVSINTGERKNGRYVYVQKNGKTEKELRQNIVKYYENLIADQLRNSSREYDKPFKEAMSEWLKNRDNRIYSSPPLKLLKQYFSFLHCFTKMFVMYASKLKPRQVIILMCAAGVKTQFFYVGERNKPAPLDITLTHVTFVYI